MSDENLKVSSKDLNILLLGPTGVGKSTFVNALYTYVTHHDLDSALHSDLQVPVPFRFTVMDEQQFEEQTVSYGSDPNELFRPGQSSTQKCKAHVIRHKDHVIRIFDTPGMDDTRGVEQDKRNFRETLNVISNVEDLHCVVILLKPNELKLTTSFSYCFKELAKRLPKTAKDHVIFVFTNAKQTFFKPEGTVKALEPLLDEVRAHVDIRLHKDNTFCVDNDVFRFVAAVKRGVDWTKDGRGEYESDWSKDREEYFRIINYVVEYQRNPVKVQCFNWKTHICRLIRRFRIVLYIVGIWSLPIALNFGRYLLYEFSEFKIDNVNLTNSSSENHAIN